MDLSTNGTFISSNKIGKNNEVQLKNGDEIYLLSRTKVPESEVMGFVFFMLASEKRQPPADDANEKFQSQKMMELTEEMSCPICDDLVYQAVTLMPCLHNFCGSCFSDWMVK